MQRLPRLAGALTAGLVCVTGATYFSAPAPVTPRSIEGTLTGWHVAVDGTVGMRLRVLDSQGEPRQLWFETAANRTDTTQFEDLVLEAAVALAAAAERGGRAPALVVRYDTSHEASGQSHEQALKLTGLTHTW